MMVSAVVPVEAVNVERLEAEGVWADAMLAAALVAIDPALGGVVLRAGAGPVRDAWLAGLRGMQPAGAPWRRAPSNIEDGRLLGGLDLAAALGAGRRVLQRGLLAEADGGVVIMAMAERLTPSTAARLAAVLDERTVSVERDGLQARSEARLALVALDEGAGSEEQPPPALIERLALHVDLHRVGVRDALPIAAGPEEIMQAREALARVAPLEPEAIEALCAAAMALGVGSMRAPWLASRTARALAALEGRDVVERDDLSTAARLVLTPRATRAPEPDSNASHAPVAGEEDVKASSTPDEREGGSETSDLGESLNDVVLDAALAALPDALKAMWVAQSAAPRSESIRAPQGGGARKVSAARGRPIGVRPGQPRSASALDLIETVKAAAPWQAIRGRAGPGSRLKVARDDLRVRRYEQRSEATVIFVVDASGSSALQRLAEAKGAVELLLAESYVRRTQVALIAFRGVAAELLLPPTRSLARARRTLAELAGGGATPLAAALEAGGALALAERGKGRTPMLVVLTDGRGNIALDGAAFRTRAETDALASAKRIGWARIATALIDTSPRPRGDGARLAEAMNGVFAPLPYVEAGAVRSVVRELDATGRR